MYCESTGRPAILHIVSSTGALSPESTTVEQWCQQSGLCVERCPHVYLGLAHLLKPVGKPFCGVLVCVEDMSPDEFEFFTLMDRTRRDVPAYVYGSRSPERVVQALQSGARGLATRDGVLALGSRPGIRAETLVASPAPAADVASAIVEPVRQNKEITIGPEVRSQAQPVQNQPEPATAPTPMVAPDARSVDAPTVSLEEADEGAEESPSGTARVPWLRYNGGPERTAPPAPRKPIEGSAPVKAAADDQEPVELFSSPCSLEDHYEPLLTEEELAALLGDEMSDISRAERDMLAGEGETPGGGAR